ncbi:MAG: glycosyltransferase [Proteobacteria bacterium]|nr:glycosyltransferase [Pseudomonadota bacterium]
MSGRRRQQRAPRAADPALRPPFEAPIPAATAPTRIEVAPEFTGGLLYGRHYAVLWGRTIAAAPIEAMSVAQAGIVLGDIEYPPEPPASDPAAPVTRGFSFTIARPAADAPLGWDFTLAVRTAEGAVHSSDFTARRDPTGGGGWLDSGPAWTDGGEAPAPPILAFVERAALDPTGNLVVSGWAVSNAPLIAVQVILDGERVGAALLGRPRNDLTGVCADYPNAARAGFLLALPLGFAAASATTLLVHAVSADGAALRMLVPLERPAQLNLPAEAARAAEPEVIAPASAPPTPPPEPSVAEERRRIQMFCDIADLREDGTLAISGWAVAAVGVDSVRVSLDGAVLGEAETGLARPDVADAFLTVPMARFAGFAFTARLPLPLPPACRIGVLVRNSLGDEAETQLEPERVARAVVAAAAADPTRFRLEIDRPAIADGAMVEPVSTRLTIEGWAVARSGLAAIAVYLDGQRLGEAHYGLARQDVERAMPDWPGALRSGFAFHCPPRLLRNGPHRIELVLRAEDGTSLTEGFGVTVQRSDAAEENATIRRRIAHGEAAALTRALDRLAARPSFRLLIRGADADAPAPLTATLASLAAQHGLDWRADLLAADAPAAAALRRWLVAAGHGAQIGVLNAAAPAGAAPWPPGPAADRLFCGVLAAGDALDAAALAEIALAAALDPDADFLYADEARPSPVSHEREPFFKPDFAPTLLLATNYIGHPWFAAAGLLHRSGATARGLLAGGEYDLVLRCTEHAAAVRHLPKLLCRRGSAALDDPAAERAALAAAAVRRGIAGEVYAGRVPGTWRLRRAAPPDALVSIIIPTNGAGRYVETCIRSLRERTSHRNFEIVCIENIPDGRAAQRDFVHANADRVLAAPAAFNWSRFNNLAAAAARGEYLLFLNDDIEVEQDDWLDAMLEHAADPDIGVVGARLLYPDRTVQHAGMFLAGTGTGRHTFRFAAADDPGYFGLAQTEREASAVTGACMLMRRAHFDALGGFDEAHDIINNDLDFCLRTAEAGRRVVYTPHATLTHHELASRGSLPETYDLAGFERRWRLRFALGDPFHNPNLSTDHDDCRPNDEPLRALHGGGPRFARAEIRRILVVKVDHIGDFVTALPAIRRLKSSFPDAAIHVLASPAAASLAALEPAIAEVIPFAFFHARSALGRIALDPAELDALRARLEPYRFDLAVDLRKHLDTRELLRCAGAPVLAGFDHLGQFPWLDIALEWEGDRALHPKRQHITEDLLRLVDAVAAAGEATAATPLRPAAAAPLPTALGALFARPVVCVHPGAGNVMKQWPEADFIALVALLLDRHPVNVLLIGGPDEAATAARLEREIAAPERLGSVAGRLALAELPGLLARCALFIGNDSGPKHIAAALGVPTVGIHSGTVDPAEWGPLGPDAVAIARGMSCAPCYLNREEDCPRALACLHGIDPGAVYRLCRPVLAALPAPAAVPAAARAGAVRAAGRRRAMAADAARAPVRS